MRIHVCPGHVMMYDRQRSMTVYFLEKGNEATFRQIKAEMSGPRGGWGGLKAYRYAKRTGDFELSLCLDQQPTEDIRW